MNREWTLTEAEWLSCADPQKMLASLLDRGRASPRKMRLYLCAGCRHISGLFFQPESLAAVEVAERFADGQAGQEELDRAEWEAEAPTFGYDFEEWFWRGDPPGKREVVPRLVEMGALPESALHGGEWAVNEPVKRRLLAAAELAEACASRSPRDWDWGRHLSGVGWPGSRLLDCVFGSPFRPLPRLDPSLLTWSDSLAVRLAQAAYEHRTLPEGHLDFQRLAVLADALEEAGAGPDILGHLRGPGPHVRGCHVLDLVLGKE